MKYRMIKPFVSEMLTFLFVVCCVFYSLLIAEYIEISVKIHLFTLTVIIIIFATMLSLFSRIMNIGVRALTDYLFQHIKEDVYIFLNQEPYRASVFTEKFNHKHESSFGMYYLIHAQKGDEIYSYISSEYLNLIKNEKYVFKIGRDSNILLTYKKCDLIELSHNK